MSKPKSTTKAKAKSRKPATTNAAAKWPHPPIKKYYDDRSDKTFDAFLVTFGETEDGRHFVANTDYVVFCKSRKNAESLYNAECLNEAADLINWQNANFHSSPMTGCRDIYDLIYTRQGALLKKGAQKLDHDEWKGNPYQTLVITDPKTGNPV